MRQRHRTHGQLLLTTLLCAAAHTAAVAHAWTPISNDRPRWTKAAPFALHQAGSQDLGGFAATEPEVRRGFEDWTKVACTSLRTEYRGTTTGRAFAGGDNSVTWYESNWFDSPSAIGITGPTWLGSDRAIQKAEMAMNGTHFTWTTESGSGNRVNTYSIASHEAGHYFGLGHSADRNAMMYYAYGGGISSLNSDDEAGICDLYPGGGGGSSGGSAGGGGGGGGGGGSTGPGTGGAAAAICSPCARDADCTSTGGRCLRYPQGMFCGGRCSSDADCGGDKCEDVTDGTKQCVRRNATGGADCTVAAGGGPAPAPGPGTGGGTGGGDGGTRPECTTDTDCGRSQRCDAGRCVDSGAVAALGEACTGNDECQSALCAVDLETSASFCTQLCTAREPCPQGFACEDAGGGLSACRPTVGGVGARCEQPSDCLSKLCAEADGERFCTRECSASNRCPSGFECIATADGATSLCVAAAPERLPSTSQPTCSAAATPRSTRLALIGFCLVGVVAGWRRRRAWNQG